MTNLEKSEQVIATILAHLFDKGIQDGDLQSGQLNLDDDLEPFFGECIHWLLNEGLIAARSKQETMDGNVFVSCPQLTAKGFAVMRQKFALGGNETTVAKTVGDASSNSTFFANMGELSGSFLGALTKSIGS